MAGCRGRALLAPPTLASHPSNEAWKPWRACERGHSCRERKWRSLPLALVGLVAVLASLGQLPNAAALKVASPTMAYGGAADSGIALPVAAEADEEDIAEEVAEENAQEGAEEAMMGVAPSEPSTAPISVAQRSSRVVSEEQLPGSDQMHQLFWQALHQQEPQLPQQPQQQEEQLLSIAVMQGYTREQAQMYVQEFWQAFPQLQAKVWQPSGVAPSAVAPVTLSVSATGVAAAVVIPRSNATGNASSLSSTNNTNKSANGTAKFLKLGQQDSKLKLKRLIVHQNEFDLKGGGTISLTNIFGSFVFSLILVALLIRFAIFVR